MSLTSVDKDLDAATMTLIADFEAPVEQVWGLWADPRKLERWWGPPGYPATFERHELAPGGEVAYFMTSPEGERHHGWWRIAAVEPPRALSFTDGFADAEGQPDESLPVSTVEVRFEERDGGTRMTMRSQLASPAQLQEMLDMGAEEGLRASIEQMDALLVA